MNYFILSFASWAYLVGLVIDIDIVILYIINSNTIIIFTGSLLPSRINSLLNFFNNNSPKLMFPYHRHQLTQLLIVVFKIINDSIGIQNKN
jgi:hypothetical protein